MAVTFDMYLEAKRQQEIGWEHLVYKTEEEALQKLGSPERLNPEYILLVAKLEKWRAESLYSKVLTF